MVQPKDRGSNVSSQNASIERDEIVGIIRDRLAEILEIEPSGISEGAIGKLRWPRSVFDQVKIVTAQKLEFGTSADMKKTSLDFHWPVNQGGLLFLHQSKGNQLGFWLNLYRRRRATIPSPKTPSRPSEVGSGIAGVAASVRCKLRR